MPKRILFVISSFRWGGINVALQNLLKHIDPSEFKADVFVMVHSGNYENQFENCTILPKNFFVDALIDHARLKSGVTKMVSGAMKILNRLTKERFQHWVFTTVGNRLAKAKDYDTVIGWHEGVPTTFVSHIEHQNKIAWIHCDYSNYDSTPRERWIYEKISTVVCVSKYCRGTFLSIFPEMESKVKAIYNILDVDGIKAKSEADKAEDMVKGDFTIVSVGRVSPVKRFCRIPEIARKVYDAGCSFKWYIVGPTYPGAEYDTLQANLDKYGMRDHVILLGGKDNPYPYIAKADLLVSTSLSEALPFVVNEAKVLGLPVVSSDYGSAYELIEDGEEGFISELSEIHKPIIDICHNSQLKDSISRRLSLFRYDNTTILDSIAALL